MKKSKTQADAGESRLGHSPPSASRLERKRKRAGAGDAGKNTPKVGKATIGSGGRKPLH